MSGTDPHGKDEELREVPPDRPRPGDKVAPVVGAELVPGDASALIVSILDRLPEKKRAKLAETYLAGQPQQIAAARQKRRERIRWWFTVFLFLGILVDGGAALYIAEWDKGASWDTVKDWLILAVAPLVSAATVAAMFWFPSKEAE